MDEANEGIEMDAEQYEHLSHLFQAHRRRLFELELQEAKWGLLAPPEKSIEITDIRRKLASISAQLGMARIGLPPPVADFMGRDDEVERITQMFATEATDGSPAMMCSICGMGGLGKTELALSIARHLKPNFPDAQVLIRLRGMSNDPVTPVQALEQIIRAFTPMDELPKELELLEGFYQRVLADKRVLILADDAKGAVQVRPLVPPSGCALLITSRNHFVLPGMGIMNLGTLPPKQAEALLLTICPRIGDASSRMAELCGYLPLALRVSAGLLTSDETRNVQRYLDLLVDVRTKLAQLRDPDDSTLDVEASLQLSYEALEQVAKDSLCQLSVFPASFNLAAAQAVVDVKGNIEVEKILGLLYLRSLLEWDATTKMYSLHDLVRAYAVIHLEDDGGAQRRLTHYYDRLMEIDYQQEKLLVYRRNLASQIKQMRRQMRQQTRFQTILPTLLSNDILQTRKEIQRIKKWLQNEGISIIDEPDYPDIDEPNYHENKKLRHIPIWWTCIIIILVAITCIASYAYPPTEGSNSEPSGIRTGPFGVVVMPAPMSELPPELATSMSELPPEIATAEAQIATTEAQIATAEAQGATSMAEFPGEIEAVPCSNELLDAPATAIPTSIMPTTAITSTTTTTPTLLVLQTPPLRVLCP